jgi:SAM-dependent methyltransferase
LSNANLAPNYEDASIEEIQSAHRRRLISAWGISPGMRILEIGCGQGDLTLALAEAVGETGHVTAVDIAPRTYGAPLTLGKATDLILSGPMAGRVTFHFEHDIRRRELSGFDAVAFAHSAWYFESMDEIRDTLSAVRTAAPVLYFAEWDIEPHSFEQMAHLLAIQIQGHVEAFATGSEANIRTPFSKPALFALLEETGWRIETDERVDSRAMQDADWEIAGALHQSLIEKAVSLGFPAKAIRFLEIQRQTLRAIAQPRGNASLDTFAIRAVSG